MKRPIEKTMKDY